MVTAWKARESDKIVNEPAASSEVSSSNATGETQLVTRWSGLRTPKSWIMSTLCYLGIHDEGEWLYVAEGNCAVEQDCRKCGNGNSSTLTMSRRRSLTRTFASIAAVVTLSARMHRTRRSRIP